MFGGEHKREAAVRLNGQPRLGLPRDVRRVIVQNDLDRSCGRIGSVEDFEELNELATAMAVLDDGMNFKGIPEYDWSWGYPYALALIALSAILPLVWFKLRGWI